MSTDVKAMGGGLELSADIGNITGFYGMTDGKRRSENVAQIYVSRTELVEVKLMSGLGQKRVVGQTRRNARHTQMR